ncbi:hypothetical protein MNL13_06215 [Bartonella krasnovii]|uniref:Uncharacterized protein n=1 Tax=Bartonella krasnovii TaxID=2267275 RepID=A0ABY3VTV1_9HYPH|nr:hypothetical protein [Bartonella krasnovii]UNF28803.1 hypothetical protein MNL13_06215 [Bartonella krasnovii]UNF35179.1 hypothetical protein MNL12_06225 [Bartonella krasnovii]
MCVLRIEVSFKGNRGIFSFVVQCRKNLLILSTRCRAIDLNHWLFGGLYPCHFLHRLVMKKNKGADSYGGGCVSFAVLRQGLGGIGSFSRLWSNVAKICLSFPPDVALLILIIGFLGAYILATFFTG